MTILKYITQSGVCSNSEILALKRDTPIDYVVLRVMAAEEMDYNNVPRDDQPTQP